MHSSTPLTHSPGLQGNVGPEGSEERLRALADEHRLRLGLAELADRLREVELGKEALRVWRHLIERADELEYGEARIEMHRDAVEPDQRIVILDDLLATGGTAAAAGRLIEGLGGRVEGYGFLVELGFLGGKKQLGESNVFSLIHYE